jgi:hypothetical protein
MIDTSVGISGPATKSCRICAEEIKWAATQCIHCKSYQDWRSTLGFSTTVLSLLVALVSVLTVALPVFKAAVTPKNSALTYTVQGSTEGRIFVLVSNLGNRPGSVAHAALNLDGVPALIVDLSEAIGAVRIIDAGKTELVEYRFRESIAGARIGDSHRACSLSMRVTDFRGKVWWATFPAECIQFTAFLQNRHQPGAATK